MIKKGQTVWIQNTSRYIGSDRKFISATVTKCGPKYFSVDAYPNDKFNRESLKQNTDYIRNLYVYLSKEEFEDEQELEKLECKIRNAFPAYGAPKFTLEQLRAVAGILFPEN